MVIFFYSPKVFHPENVLLSSCSTYVSHTAGPSEPGVRKAEKQTHSALCVEIGFRWTFLGKQIETEEGKSEVIFVFFEYYYPC